jgi:xylulokinase
MLGLSGIDRRLLPEILPSTTIIGEVHDAAAAATGIPAGTPVVLGGHDHLCGSLPVGTFRPGVVLDVTGTWESVLTTIPEPVLMPRVREAGITVQSHVARGVYSAWCSTPAGESLEWFRRHFGPLFASVSAEERQTDWDVLMAAAASSPAGARGVLFLPHLSTTSCPIPDDRSLGAFSGLSTAVGPGDLLRAVIEGLDYQFLDVVRTMEVGLDRSFDKFVAVGGAVRNAFWMQNKADVVGRTVEVPNVEEATSLGAAILAGVGLGLYRDEEEAYQRVGRPGESYEPDARRAARYAEWFEIYRDLYPSLRPVSHRLFDGPRA